MNGLITVIDNNMCIGCGACEVFSDGIAKVKMNQYGLLSASIPESKDLPDGIDYICPFSDLSMNEDEISEEFFPSVSNQTKYVGKHIACYAGVCRDESIREKASSGGIIRWMLKELVKRNAVDGVIHVVSGSSETTALFSYKSEEGYQPHSSATSAYYPVTYGEAINKIKADEKKYAFVGLPCFVKSIRLLMLNDSALKTKLPYTISLVCGSLKSAFFAEMIGWQLGIEPSKIDTINFRGKTSDKKASIKKFVVTSKSGDKHEKLSKDLFGTNYSLGLFKPLACDFCDDVVGETADMSVGDAWLPEYVKDPRGTSVVVVRNQNLHRIIEDGINTNELRLDKIDANKVVNSQKSGIRHRNEGLEYRIHALRDHGRWIPKKRVKPGLLTLFKGRHGLYMLRYTISTESHDAFLKAKSANNFDIFKDSLSDLISKHKTLYKKNKNLLISLKETAFKIIKRVMQWKR
jgi:coenzyme F420 hydrogenase subunit beta